MGVSEEDGVVHVECADEWTPPDGQYSKYVMLCATLVAIGGVMSGLQQGMFSITELDIISEEHDIVALQTKNKSLNTFNSIKLRLLRMLRPLISHTHLTLVTLLVANAIAMEALPVYMDSLMPKHYAVLISVSLLVFFGEVIPQALCIKYPLWLTLICVMPVWILLIFLSPICLPISLLLDYILGNPQSHFHHLNRAGLTELAMKHSSENKGPLTNDEIDVITGALAFSGDTVESLYVPLSKAFMLEYNEEVDEDMFRTIADTGHSRIPIYKKTRDNIVGLLLTKTLIRFRFPHAKGKRSDDELSENDDESGVGSSSGEDDFSSSDEDSELKDMVADADHDQGDRQGRVVLEGKSGVLNEAKPLAVKDFQIYPCMKVSVDTPLFGLLAQFRTGSSHLAIVTDVEPPAEANLSRAGSIDTEASNASRESHTSKQSTSHLVVPPSGKPLGIVTLEDCIERLIKRDISDEKDTWGAASHSLEGKLAELKTLRASFRGILRRQRRRKVFSNSVDLEANLNRSGEFLLDEKYGLLHEVPETASNENSSYGAFGNLDNQL